MGPVPRVSRRYVEILGENPVKDDLKQRWEERALARGATPESVLFQGLPPAINRHIHDWHSALVKSQLLPRLPPAARLLELGCGYGRIGAVIRSARTDIELTGMDFSLAYCRLYRDHVGKVACGDLSTPPFPESGFDGLVMVTSLMYLAKAHRAESIFRILRLMRPGAHALIIDPGREFQKLVARLRPSSRRNTTGGEGFTLAEHRLLARSPEIRLVACGGNPALTALLPLLYLLHKCDAVQSLCSRLILPLDARPRRLSRYSMHRWLLLQRHT